MITLLRDIKKILQKERSSLAPVFYVVRVLPQVYTVLQLRIPSEKVIKPSQPQICIIIVIQPVITDQFVRNLIVIPLQAHSLHLSPESALLKLCVGVKDDSKVSGRDDSGKAFFKDVAGLLKETPADIVVSKGGPETANLVGVLANAATYDAIDIDAGDLFGVVGKEVAELQPELVLSLALDGVEGVVVEDRGKAVGGLLP